jgi:hypothetical protein
MSYRHSFLSVGLLCLAGNVLAQPIDARAVAMGGSGVAGASYQYASFHNPALLSHVDDSDDFALVLPAITVSAADNDQVVDGIDNLQLALDRYYASPNETNASLAQQSLLALDNNKATAKVSLAMAVVLPNRYLATALFAHGYLDGNVLTDIDSSDINRLVNDNTELLSSASVIAVGVLEVGMSFAHAFELEPVTLSVGISPKYQQLETFFYNNSVADFDQDNFDADQYRQQQDQLNIDLGLTATWQNGFVLGVSARNLISQQLHTVQLNDIAYLYEIKPQYTVAASYQSSWFNANIDAELNSKRGFALQDESQWLAAGVEFNAVNWAQIRFGYRDDLKSNQQSQLTAGIGFSPFATVHLDVAAMYADKNDAGAAMSLAFTF